MTDKDNNQTTIIYMWILAVFVLIVLVSVIWDNVDTKKTDVEYYIQHDTLRQMNISGEPYVCHDIDGAIFDCLKVK